MNIIRIEDAGDPRTDLFSRFCDAELARGRTSKGPLEQGPVFIAESRKVIERACAAGVEPCAVFGDEGWLERSRDLIDALCARNRSLPVYATSAELFREITGYAQVRGILAAMKRPRPVPPGRLLENASRVAVLENVGNYTNVGAIFRCAAALGVDAVLLAPGCHDPLYRRAARVSMGTVFQVPWGRIGDLGAGDGEGARLLRGFGFETVALALCDESVPIDDPALAARPKLAMVLGSEGDGLAPQTVARCDWTARIPMSHGVDSLNVAAASALAFWELRKR